MMHTQALFFFNYLFLLFWIIKRRHYKSVKKFRIPAIIHVRNSVSI